MTVHDHPERIRAQARGDQAERLVGVALDLAILVRDEGPEAIASFLGRLTGGDRYRLLTVLAAMVDVDRTPEELLAWVTFDESGQPLEGATPVLPIFAREEEPDTPYEDCGTLKAFYRHVRAGQKSAAAEACGCAQAYRDHKNAKYAATRDEDVTPRARKSEAPANRESYARYRSEGDTIGQAAERVGVALRTAGKYEAALLAAGRAPWREAARAA